MINALAGEEFPLLLQLLLVLCVIPQSEQISSDDCNTPGWLTVYGSRIQDDQGEVVFLRGMNMDLYYHRYDNNHDAPFDYAFEEDIEYLAGIGCNSLRLSLNWKLFQTDAGFQLVDRYLSWCEPRGIYIILDMHVAPPGDRISNRGIWDLTDAQEQLIQIWQNIASRYSNRSCIAGYDLYNEPSPYDPQQWWDLAQLLVESIREVDENHMIFVQSSSWDGTGFRIIDDPNVVYSFHYYQPFVVSHAAATWSGDSPVPDEYAYPGTVINSTRWVDWSSDVNRLRLPSENWIEWESGSITVPSGVEWASLKLYASGDVGSVLFDEIQVLCNGNQTEVFNWDIEENSPRRAGEARNWFFYGDGDYSGMVSSDSYSGNQSLMLNGSTGSGTWVQRYSFFTEPLLRVQPGDVLQVRGMIKAPENFGEISLCMEFLKGDYFECDVDWIRNDINRLVQWAEDYEVPLYVGEFGAVSGSDPQSRYNLVTDWVSVMNELGLHWSYWTYRSGSLDEITTEILTDGFLWNK